MFCRITRPALTIPPVVGLLVAYLWLSRGPSCDDLRRDGDRMAEAVENYRFENGHYPESLEEAGVVAPECPYAAWRYRCYGGHYRLSVGDGKRDGFCLTYRSASGTWELDT